MRWTALLLPLALLAACSDPVEAPPPEPAEETRRTISQGELVGFRAETGAQVWRGIPFAAPPVGDLRWRAPRPAGGWDGAYEALAFAPRCAQVTNALNQSEGLDPGLLVGEEDCLYLNVYAPSDAEPGEDLPVMVWIHGGGNVWGRASNYDGSVLAETENVVIVTIQYRLGPLGWFAHEAIRDSAETPADRAANFALLDMIAALDWVGNEIAAFGGDPARVTIFGESAGGHNVAGLLVSPLAEGLFHRAIIQSGSLDSLSLEEAEAVDSPRPNPSQTATAAFAPSGEAAAMRAASLEALFTAYGFPDTAIEVPIMIADGVSLPVDGLRGALAREGGFNAVPVITGTNRDEMKLFNLLNDQLTRQWFGLIYRAKDPDFYNVLSEYQGRMWRIGAVDETANRLRSAGHEAVYGYRFDWDEAGRALTMDFAELLGAAHAMEIPFVFSRFELFGDLDRVIFNDDNAEGREALSRAMGGYWSRFAAEGAPGDGGNPALPDWPVWGDQARLMRFDSPADGGPAELISGADSLERLIADLRRDDRLSDDQRCAIAATLGDRFIASKSDVAAISSLDCPSA